MGGINFRIGQLGVALVLHVCLCLNSPTSAQNLIPNGSFEQYNRMPNGEADHKAIQFWESPAVGNYYPYATPNYFHKNGEELGKIPNEKYGDLKPKEGKAMVGLYYTRGDFSEYLTVKLKKRLSKGQKYEVKFFASAGAGKGYSRSITSGFGVALSVNKPVQKLSEWLLNMPPYYTIPDPEDLNNEWKEFKFVFVADNDFEYLTIGNFLDTNKIMAIDYVYRSPTPFREGYIFIDEFSLTETLLAQTANQIPQLAVYSPRTDDGIKPKDSSALATVVSPIILPKVAIDSTKPEGPKEIVLADPPKNVMGREVEVQNVIKSKSKKVTIKVYDGKEVDGDIITLVLNDQVILEKYTLKGNAYTIDVELVEGRNFLSLFAVNLGRIPPNTATVEIYDDKLINRLELRSTLKTSGLLAIDYIP